jgi:N-acetyl-gamma-glutamyl-phosphate reductase
MIRAGIVGLSGYSGCALLEILMGHPELRVTYVSANNTVGRVDTIWPHLKERTELVCNKFDLKMASDLCDVVFLAVPHTVAMTLAPRLLNNNLRVVDISGDYRLNSPAEYKKWYGKEHADVKNLNKAVYGLPELYRTNIKTAKLVSNPGCYPTAAILGLAPLVSIRSDEIESIIIDAKSGVSGAGKKTAEALMFAEVNENFRAYKVLTHQHTPEIELHLAKLAKLRMPVTFVPHLLPITRGILATLYVRLSRKESIKGLYRLYKNFYKTEPFVRIMNEGLQPELKNVNHTNFCDIGLACNEKQKIFVITSVIDNLIKGAAGQAVQNMNIMYQFQETMGLL